jgi:xanthine dehydrogenase accessory factor
MGNTDELIKEVIIEEGDNKLEIEPAVLENGKTSVFVEPVAPRERLIILGGGHIAVSLCEFASKVGFYVIIVDDRPEFANGIRFPWASEVICDSYKNALKNLKICSCDYVTILTRGHRYDLDCLRYIMKNCIPYYLGMVGSKRRVNGVFNMLSEEGYDRTQMSNICTPIGLDIGAVLPEEIAISILAELILYKRKKNTELNYKSITSDLDMDVISHLAAIQELTAVVTVMRTKGSTPRGAGAKMAVNRYGKIYGSIGGGCAERSIINDAVHIIGTGEYRIEEIDMTGDIAENDGMVCGGIMQVLIEDFV